MQKKTAEELVYRLEHHPELFVPKNNLLDQFVSYLEQTKIPVSKHLVKLDAGHILINEKQGHYHYISLDSILSTKQIRMPGISNISSDDIINLIANSSCPYVLLASYQTYDSTNEDNVLFRATRPVLIIPGVKNILGVLAWENKNTIYEKEICPFGHFSLGFRKIKSKYADIPKSYNLPNIKHMLEFSLNEEQRQQYLETLPEEIREQVQKTA